MGKFWDIGKVSLAEHPDGLLLINENGDTVLIAPGGTIKGRILTFCSAPLPWANQPAALTELVGNTLRRVKADLEGLTEFRFFLQVIANGSAGSVYGLQFSIDGGTTWRGLDNGTAGSLSTATVSTATSPGAFASSFVSLHVDARTDVLLRVAGTSDVSTGDPSTTTIAVQFR